MNYLSCNSDSSFTSSIETYRAFTREMRNPKAFRNDPLNAHSETTFEYFKTQGFPIVDEDDYEFDSQAAVKGDDSSDDEKGKEKYMKIFNKGRNKAKDSKTPLPIQHKEQSDLKLEDKEISNEKQLGQMSSGRIGQGKTANNETNEDYRNYCKNRRHDALGNPLFNANILDELSFNDILPDTYQLSKRSFQMPTRDYDEGTLKCIRTIEEEMQANQCDTQETNTGKPHREDSSSSCSVQNFTNPPRRGSKLERASRGPNKDMLCDQYPCQYHERMALDILAKHGLTKQMLLDSVKRRDTARDEESPLQNREDEGFELNVEDMFLNLHQSKIHTTQKTLGSSSGEMSASIMLL